MNTDNLITPESLTASLKMAADGMKKNPKVMKSTVGYMELLNILFKRIESKSAPIIIDAPTGTEFKRGHIPVAINAPPQKILLKTASLPEN